MSTWRLYTMICVAVLAITLPYIRRQYLSLFWPKCVAVLTRLVAVLTKDVAILDVLPLWPWVPLEARCGVTACRTHRLSFRGSRDHASVRLPDVLHTNVRFKFGYRKFKKIIWSDISAFVHGHYQVCARTLPGLCTDITRFVHGHYQVCARTLPGLCTDITRFVHGHYQVCARTLPGLCTDITRFVHGHYQACARTLPGLCTDITRLVHGHYQVCARTLSGLCTDITRFVHGHYQVCARTLPGLCTDITRFVHGHYQVCARTLPGLCTDITRFAGGSCWEWNGGFLDVNRRKNICDLFCHYRHACVVIRANIEGYRTCRHITRVRNV